LFVSYYFDVSNLHDFPRKNNLLQKSYNQFF
jgi:hypothetical protein